MDKGAYLETPTYYAAMQKGLTHPINVGQCVLQNIAAEFLKLGTSQYFFDMPVS